MTRPVEELRVGPLTAAPLKLALVQAQTPLQLAFEKPDTLQTLTERLEGWTLADRQTKVEGKLRLAGGGVEQLPGSQETVWILAGPGDRFRGVISSTSVAVECDDYQHWDDFRAALEQVLSAVVEIAPPPRCSRLGVRYINELSDPRLDGAPQAMTAIVAPELLEPGLSSGSRLISTFAETRLDEGEGARLTVRHGWTPEQSFLLDFDAYTETAQPFEPASLIEAAQRFHDRIESFFAWSLNPDFLAALQAPPDSGGPS